MQNLKYYVLGTKNSPLLKQYFQKFYEKLLKDLEKVKNSNPLSPISKSIKTLLETNYSREFILDGDISSLINSIIIDNNSQSLEKLKNEIDIFLLEGIGSENLLQNKGTKISGTNIKLTLQDNNPYKGNEAHPDHLINGGVLGWGEKSEQEWLSVYEKTFSLLKKVDEGIYDELNQIITKIIPLGTARSLHNSSSYKECIGHLYLGYTIDTPNPEINNLEAIIHESSHNKLNLLMHFDPIVLNDKKQKYYSAIRPDARHIHGILLGYHAFAPTIYIMMKSHLSGFFNRNDSIIHKIVLYYLKVKFLQKVMKKYAKFTKLGYEVNREMDYVVSKMDILFKELNPDPDIIVDAKKIQKQHFYSVNKNYPYLEY